MVCRNDCNCCQCGRCMVPSRRCYYDNAMDRGPGNSCQYYESTHSTRNSRVYTASFDYCLSIPWQSNSSDSTINLHPTGKKRRKAYTFQRSWTISFCSSFQNLNPFATIYGNVAGTWADVGN